MSKTQAADNALNCEHCERVFQRETTLLRHMCEPKRRWLDRERPGNRIAYNSWVQYYRTCHPNKKNLDYVVFSKSSYYIAFVKFGNYCVDVRVLNPSAYVNWLIRNRTPLDSWASDRTYERYLVEYLRQEDSMEAVQRSIENMLELAQQENITLQDVLRYANTNRLCRMLVTGQISPWIIFHTQSGLEFLGKLHADQQAVVLDYIDPDRWNLKFHRCADEVQAVKNLVKNIPGL